jgi:hypothetical protein
MKAHFAHAWLKAFRAFKPTLRSVLSPRIWQLQTPKDARSRQLFAVGVIVATVLSGSVPSSSATNERSATSPMTQILNNTLPQSQQFSRRRSLWTPMPTADPSDTAGPIEVESLSTNFNIADGDVAGLIAAIDTANGNGQADTINLAPGGTYTLTVINNTDNGLPIITSQITINGNGATIQRSSAVGTPDFRIINASNGDLTLDSVTIKGGRAAGGGGLAGVGSKLVVVNSTVIDNISTSNGGGIYNRNSGSAGGALTLINSTVSHNTGFGGRTGGGILNFTGPGSFFATATIINSTVFENRADGSPGFQGRGDAIADAFSPAGSIIIKNSILASPTQGLGDELYGISAGTLTSLGHNIVGDDSGGLTGPGDLNSTDPLLGPLANNGGPTQTHAPLLGSPAIDAVPLADLTDADGNPITTDQRGVARPQGAAGDIGSVELTPTPTFTIDDVTHNEGDVGTTSYVFMVTRTGTTPLSATVDYETVDGTAVAPGDYTAILPPQTLTFGPTDTTIPITVLVNRDTNFEPNEVFNVHLSGAVNATIADADGTGTILNDDATPATLGNYANTTVQLGANTTITPDAAPTNTMRLTVFSSTNFKGKLEGNPLTGVVRVTDAHPAGTYTVTVTAFDSGGVPTATTFTLTVTTPVTCNPVSFATAVNFGVGNGPTAVAIGDFDGDGEQDLATTNAGSDNVSVLLGNGAGSFGAPLNFGVGTTPFAVAVGDFNGDGKQDLVSANFNSANVSVLLGDGAGSFSPATNFAAGTFAISVAVGDFNGDGKQDLAVANGGSDNVSVLLGDGAGGFIAATNFGAGTQPRSVAVGDFDGDGKQDLAVSNEASNNVSVFLGNGAGGFSAATNFAVGANPRSVAIGDFNDDGKQDLAVANTNSFSVSILLGDGLGSFSAAVNFAVVSGGFPFSVVVGDFNGDGEQDLAVANPDTDNVSVLLGNGAGGFSVPTNFGVGDQPRSVAVGDFDGDGKQDLATANNLSDNVSVLLRKCGPTASNSTVSGQITESTGNPVEGAAVRLGGTQNRLVVTDREGNYHFDDVETGGFYTVTPSRANYMFTPAQRSFSLVGNRTDAVFTAVSTGDNVNPLETPEFFVRQQYLDFLGREPDEAGFNYWSDQILACNGETNCVSAKRLSVAAAFFIAQEFQDSGLYIYDVYQGALGRRPDHAEYAVDRRLVVGGPRLEADKAAFATSFVERPEFSAQYPLTMSDEVFVDALLRTAEQSSGLDLSNTRAALITLYNTGATATESRSLVLRSLVEGSRFKQTQYNPAFVLMEYYGYLGRNPDGAGYDFWLNVLNSGDRNNYRGMVCSFITSAEYQRRFSTVVTRSNAECGRIAKAGGSRQQQEAGAEGRKDTYCPRISAA